MQKKFYPKNSVNSRKGFTLVEVLIGCAIISVTVFALMVSARKTIQLSNRALKQAQANTLLEEGVEAVKSIRDNSWSSISSLASNTNYYLYFNTGSNEWTLSLSTSTPPLSVPTYPIDGTFNRFVVFTPVYRDSNDNISDTGTVDNGTEKVAVTVSWNGSSGPVSKNLVFYLTNLFN